MKSFKKWLAAAGLLFCLMAGGISVYAEPEETKTETTQETSVPTENPKATKEAEPEKTTEATKTPEPTKPPETPKPTEEPEQEKAKDTEEDRTNDAAEEKETIPDAAKQIGLELPSGNLTLAEDIVSVQNGNREFLTVYSREGDYFYIIIDRDSNGTGNVYFLNMVDDQDLYSLSGDAIPDRTAVHTEGTGSIGTGEGTTFCTCVDRCSGNDIDTSCPVCREDPQNCKGLKSGANPTDTNIQESKDSKSEPELNLPMLVGGVAALIFLLLIYFLKMRKKEKKPHAEDYDIEDYLTYEGEDDDGNDS